MATHPPLGQYSTTPVFNTKAVARETEVPADTFRAWERRYGIPRPQRTAGGHRLYSERDIAIIRWLRDRTAEGMNISQAVMLLNNSLAEAAEELPPAPIPPPSYEPRAMHRLVDDLTGALVAFDAQRAERQLAEAFALYPVEDVLLHVVQPTMVELGERWHRGEINVASEHFATQFVRRKLAAMVNMFDGDGGRGKIIVACTPDEQHDLGALFVALFLVRKGWHVIYLGPQVPVPDLLESIHTTRPDLVCLSASMPETAIQVTEVAQAIHNSFPQVHIGYGGRIFNTIPELRETIPAVFLGEDAREFSDNVAALLSRGSTSTVEH
ncbi:MAG: cobalamin-dependent protein [Roseiflexaceae bacterium]